MPFPVFHCDGLQGSLLSGPPFPAGHWSRIWRWYGGFLNVHMWARVQKGFVEVDPLEARLLSTSQRTTSRGLKGARMPDMYSGPQNVWTDAVQDALHSW